MGSLSYTLPTIGSLDTTEEPLVRTALAQLLTLVNGNLDATNLAPSAAITAGQLDPAAGISAAQLASSVADLLALSQGGTARRGYALVATAQSVSAIGANDLATVGPTVTLTCPPGGGLVFLYPYAEILHSPGNGQVWVDRDGGGLQINGSDRSNLIVGGSSAFTAYTTNYGNKLGPPALNPVVLPESAGSHIYQMKYGSDGTSASFRNRQLWAWVMGF